jgi:hypothetical protein
MWSKVHVFTVRHLSFSQRCGSVFFWAVTLWQQANSCRVLCAISYFHILRSSPKTSSYTHSPSKLRHYIPPKRRLTICQSIGRTACEDLNVYIYWNLTFPVKEIQSGSKLMPDDEQALTLPYSILVFSLRHEPHPRCLPATSNIQCEFLFLIDCKLISLHEFVTWERMPQE